MIKGVNGGTGITVNNGWMSWPTFYNNPGSIGNTLIGQVRYNGSSQNFEVYDGNSWLILQSSYTNVELSGDTQTILNWARTKMFEERRIQELAETNPAVKAAVEDLQRAEEQVRIVAALVDTE